MIEKYDKFHVDKFSQNNKNPLNPNKKWIHATFNLVEIYLQENKSF